MLADHQDVVLAVLMHVSQITESDSFRQVSESLILRQILNSNGNGSLSAAGKVRQGTLCSSGS